MIALPSYLLSFVCQAPSAPAGPPCHDLPERFDGLHRAPIEDRMKRM
jgi:hypothetical protein